MQVFPALKAAMGSWSYYTVKMTMKDVAQNVKFASDIHDERTLEEAIQRSLNTSRVNKEIITYLIKQEDRFFSSIVIAALHGNPKWYPVTMEDDERFEVFKDDPRMSNAFGVIRFDGSQEYYALDGQHRLAAIRKLLDHNDPDEFYKDKPDGFEQEELVVLLMVPGDKENDENFLIRYRRLFGHLNRYARKTDKVTDIIMDEDDGIAISTRKLISEHEFFKWEGPEMDSPRIKMDKGANMRTSDAFFTQLEILYAMNTTLLHSGTRSSDGWFGESSLEVFKRYRPDDEVLERLSDELLLFWTGLRAVLPDLDNNAPDMRNHFADEAGDGTSDSALFWPITQQLLANIARQLLNTQPDPDRPTPETVEEALKPLGKINWNLHEAPWRLLILVSDFNNNGEKIWKMRSEDRKRAQVLAQRILEFQLGLAPLGEEEQGDLRQTWESMLYPRPKDEECDSMWEQILDGVIR